MKNVFFWLAVVAGSLFASTSSIAATIILNPGDNLTAAVETAADGDTLQLNPGVYTPMPTGAFPASSGGTVGFAITKSVRIVGVGSTPAAVTLSAPATTSYAIRFFSYIYAIGTPPPVGNPSGVTLENLTISSAAGGASISETTFRLSDITLRNVVINATANTPTSFGVLLDQVDRVALDGVQVTSYSTGFNIRNSTETLLMNSTVISTTASGNNALAVDGGSHNVISNNILGTPAVAPATVTVNGGAVVFYNTQNNRFELNTVQGHRDDRVAGYAVPLP